MTLALPARPDLRERAPGAVHVDGTARPQVVDEASDPWLARVLERFELRTGCPALINTSFNLHREPIVCSADDARRTAAQADLDAVVIGAELELGDAHARARELAETPAGGMSWNGGKPTGSASPPAIVGPTASDAVLEDRR